MKYKVLGARLLLKIQKATDKYEGSVIARATQDVEKDTMFQTKGEIVQIGPSANTEFKGIEGFEIGHIVHFQRYGAIRVSPQEMKDEPFEYWVINAKDVQCIEITEAPATERE